MPYSITDCKTIKDDSNVIIGHYVFYSFDDGAGNTKTVRIPVDAAEMTDPADNDELKTVANTKASLHKTDWLNEVAAPNTTSSSSALNGSVTI